MTYKVLMTETAIEDEIAILEYLSDIYPPAIKHYEANFERFIAIVTEMPEIAQKWVLNSEFRCWVMYPYRIFYKVDKERKNIYIASIVHGKKEYPNL